MVEIEITKSINKRNLFNAKLKLVKGIYLLKGENGVGKTTFLNILSKKDKNYEGTILINDRDIKNINEDQYNNYISYLSQEVCLFDNLTCIENFEILIGNVDTDVLDLVEVLGFEKVFSSKKRVKKLSGGEKQKLQILLNFSKKANIYLLDEIDNNLDRETISKIMPIIKRLNAIVIVVSHNEEYLKDYIDSILTLENNKIVESNKTFKDIEPLEFKENNNKKKLLKVDFKKISKHYNKLKVFNSLIILLISFFICLLLGNIIFYLSFSTQVEESFADNVSVVTSPRNNSLYYPMGEPQKWLKKIKYNFTDEDLEYIESLEYIKTIKPIPVTTAYGGSYSYYVGKDSYDYDGTINYSTLDYEKYGMEKYKLESSGDIYPMNFVYPSVLFENTGLLDENFNVSEVTGDFPEDNSNEILIDVYCAMYIAQSNNMNSLDDVIGYEVTLPMKKFESDIIENFTFKISGFYIPTIDSGLEHSSIGSIFYTAYNEEAQTVISNNCSLIDDRQSEYFKMCQKQYVGIPLDQDISDEQLKDIGLYPAFYIEVEDESDNKNLVKDLKEYDPYIEVDNNYTRSKSTSFIYMRDAIIKQILFLIIFIIVYISSILFVRKLNNVNNEKIKKVLLNYGYSNTEYRKYKKVQANRLFYISTIIILLLLILNSIIYIWFINIIIFAIIYYILILISWIFLRN